MLWQLNLHAASKRTNVQRMKSLCDDKYSVSLLSVLSSLKSSAALIQGQRSGIMTCLIFLSFFFKSFFLPHFRFSYSRHHVRSLEKGMRGNVGLTIIRRILYSGNHYIEGLGEVAYDLPHHKTFHNFSSYPALDELRAYLILMILLKILKNLWTL